MKLEPELLADKSRLQEIYDLRVEVWEHSGKNQLVNKKLFPKGWHDPLDESGLHWVVNNEEGKIIAAARLNIFNSFEEFPYYPFMQHLPLPTVMPFAFYSRLVIHPEYQRNGFSNKLVHCRMQYCEAHKIPWLQVLINNPHIINLFEKLECQTVGKAMVNYHEFTEPHSVNVFIRENNYRAINGYAISHHKALQEA